MNIGPTTEKIFNSIANELKKESVQKHICNDILSPIMNQVASKYYYHYIFILILQITIIFLLGLVIYLYFFKLKKESD